MESNLHDIESGHSGLDDGQINVSSDTISHDVLLFRWIGTASDGNSSAVPASDGSQFTGPWWSEEDPGISPK